jgi:hypothetical protein
MRERSLELAGMLESQIPVVDKTGIREARAESSRLAGEARRARDQVAEAVRKGLPLPPGCTLGVQPPIRKVPSEPGDRRAYDTLQGRPVISEETLEHWRYRRDVVAAAVEGCYRRAAEQMPQATALTAAAKGHLAVLAQRDSYRAEAGEALEVALRALEDVAGVLRGGIVEAQEIANEASAELDRLRAEVATARVAASGVDLGLNDRWIAGRVAGALGIELIGDLANPLGAPAGPATTPVTGRPARGEVRGRSAAEVGLLVRETLLQARADAEPDGVPATPHGVFHIHGGGSILGVR